MRLCCCGPLVVTGLLLAGLLGCQRGGNERYIPPAPLAREALAASLDAWQRREEEPDLGKGKPKIELADSQRVGRQLESYEILGELAIEGGRRFEVRLNLANPTKEETVQYIVLGIDPLWVMHQRDYEIVTRWEMSHDKPPDAAKSGEEKPNE